VWIDECYVARNTYNRRFGWSLMYVSVYELNWRVSNFDFSKFRGNRAVGRPSFWRNPRYSVLGAVSCDGVLDYTVISGSVNGHEFFWWFSRYLVPKLGRHPFPLSTIILDNVSIHKYRPFIILTELLGINVIYLPPYSPWINVIEYLFCILKMRIRRMGVNFTQNMLFNIIKILHDCRETNFRSLATRIGY